MPSKVREDYCCPAMAYPFGLETDAGAMEAFAEVGSAFAYAEVGVVEGVVLVAGDEGKIGVASF